MNELIYRKRSKVINICLEKTKEISLKHYDYIWDNSKWGKRWNYYNALAVRLLKEQQEMLDKEEQILKELK